MDFSLQPSAFASWVTNWFGEGNGSTNTITVNFKPTGTPYVLPNGQTIISYAFSVTATNGILAPIWLATGPWTATFGSSFDTWKLNVPYDSNTYALWQLATNVSGPTNFPVITLATSGGVTAAELAAQGESMTNWIDDNFALLGDFGVTSVAVAADHAGVVSWSGSPDTSTGTFTPTFSLATSSQLGVVRVDNATITSAIGVLSANGANLSGLVPGGFANFPPNTVLANASGSAAAPTASGTLSVANVDTYNEWVSNNLFVIANVYGAAAVLTNSLNLPYAAHNTVAYVNSSGNLVSGGTYSGGTLGTVTSVAIAADGAGVVSWSGSPISTSGTLAPTFSKLSASQFGVAEVDNSTIVAIGGVISVVGAALTNTPPSQWNGGTTTLMAASPEYYALTHPNNSTSGSSGSTSAKAQTLAVYPYVISNLWISGYGLNAGTNCTVTLVTNGGPSALSTTLTGTGTAGTTTYTANDSTHTVNVTNGEPMTIEITQSGTPAVSQVYLIWSLGYHP